MLKKAVFFTLLLSSRLYAVEESPWIGNLYEFNIQSKETYSRYRWIDSAFKQPSYAYNNYVTDVGISFVPAENLDLGLELEMARTPFQLYGFRSSALGARYVLLDDIAGDPLSLTLGLNLRAVSSRSVRDVSSPYASYMNYEITTALGKEFSEKGFWISRFYALGSIGIANHGSVWNRAYAAFEKCFFQTQVIKVFTVGYFGYGPKKIVDSNNFYGWGEVCHRSIDCGIQYRYGLSVWGEIGLSYAYRVLARSYPQNTQTAEISYTLPFSFF